MRKQIKTSLSNSEYRATLSVTMPTPKKTTLHVQVDKALREKLEGEQRRLEDASPGSRVTVSDVVRSLLERSLRSPKASRSVRS